MLPAGSGVSRGRAAGVTKNPTRHAEPDAMARYGWGGDVTRYRLQVTTYTAAEVMARASALLLVHGANVSLILPRIGGLFRYAA
jgi:hypothetical protein